MPVRKKIKATKNKEKKKGDSMFATARTLTPARVLQKIGSVKSAIEKFDSEMKLHHYKIREFKPNVSFSFERGNYVVKSAENGEELEACLKLRFEVFHREFMHKKRKIGVDIDKLDYVCDHLVIADKRDGRVIGTYRLNSSMFTDTFYSTAEFHMQKLLEMEGNKLELGRACIDKDHRNGAVIALLWRGIAEYIQRTNTKVLFGCGSVKSMEPLEIGLMTHHLIQEGYLTYEYGVEPTKKYKVKQLARTLEYIENNPYVYNKEEMSKQIPTLFHAYLRLGAKLCGEPAIDRDFHCTDYLILVKMDDMDPLYKDKYKI